MGIKLTRDAVEVIEKETPFKGYFQIDRYKLRHKLHDGGTSAPMEREIFERGHAVGVVLYDPDHDLTVLIEQFRPGAYAAGFRDPWLIEIVAGIIEEGESPESVARREAVEEAGCEVLDIFHAMHYIVSPGGSSETLHLYCARVNALESGGLHGLAHEGEYIHAFAVPVDEALALLDNPPKLNSTTIIALQWLALNREKLKLHWPKEK